MFSCCSSTSRAATWVIAVTILTASCSTGTDPGACELPECLPVNATLLVWQLVERRPDGDRLSAAASARFLQAFDAGVVRINSVPLMRGDGNPNAKYVSGDSALMLRRPPLFNVWSVSGSPPIPPILDSVPVSDEPLMLAPLPGDTVSIAHGIHIRWTPATTGDTDPLVEFAVRDEGGHGLLLRAARESIGEATIGEVDILASGIGPGQIVLQFRRVGRTHRLTGSRYHYEMVVERMESVIVNLRE